MKRHLRAIARLERMDRMNRIAARTNGVPSTGTCDVCGASNQEVLEIPGTGQHICERCFKRQHREQESENGSEE